MALTGSSESRTNAGMNRDCHSAARLLILIAAGLLLSFQDLQAQDTETGTGTEFEFNFEPNEWLDMEPAPVEETEAEPAYENENEYDFFFDSDFYALFYFEILGDYEDEPSADPDSETSNEEQPFEIDGLIDLDEVYGTDFRIKETSSTGARG